MDIVDSKKILLKYIIPEIVDIIYDYAYYCKCVGHPLTQLYCDYCNKYDDVVICEITGIKCGEYKNVCFGSMTVSSSFGNTCIGHNSFINNISGSSSTAVGYNSLATNICGSFNTVIGVDTGCNLAEGNFNTCIGSITTGSAGAGSSLGKSSSGNICIGNTGRSTDNCTVRIGNKRDHKDVFLPNRTHLDILHFPEYIHDLVKSHDTIMIPLDESLILIPLVEPFPLKKLKLIFPKFDFVNGGQTKKMVFFHHNRDSVIKTIAENLEFSKNVISSSIFQSITPLTQATEWYASSKLGLWIRIG